MSTKTIDEAAKVFTDPCAYADRQRLHTALAHLRANAPVSWVDVPNYGPFWAITKHADLLDIERDHKLFTNAPRPILASREHEPLITSGRTLIHIDDPEHGPLRAIAAKWFGVKAMRTVQACVDELAKTYVDRLLAAGPECDFVLQVSMEYPLAVMMSLLGLPESAAPCLIQLTREMFNPDDYMPGNGSADAALPPGVVEASIYFAEVIAARRKQPTEDLASAIANARIDGEPLQLVDAVSHFILLATAGHDTASSTISGGLLALLENSDQLDRLRDDPGLLPAATEEMLRWVTPTKQFMRTAVKDSVVRGERITAGESVLLSYVSANHDEDVFDDPCKFVIGRESNKHLAFGHGPHYCLGAGLARMEVKSIFTELLSRLKTIELGGAPQHHASVWVSGLKSLPIRYSPN